MQRAAVCLAVGICVVVAIAGMCQAITVYDIKALPNVLTTYTYFTAVTLPANYALDFIQVKVYNSGGTLVATITGENANRLYWNGGTLPNGAYIYRATYSNWDGHSDSGSFGPYILYISR
jgi:hypothetical protein